MISYALYKNTPKSSQIWYCKVEGRNLTISYGTSYGKQQTIEDTYPSPEDALKAAKQKRDKKVNREGYSEDPTAIAPSMPMLSHEYSKYGMHLPEHVFIQPKLNGFRCVGNKEVLLSRKNLVWSSVPHILEEIRKLNCDLPYPLDGELYADGFTFEELQSIVMRDHPHRKMGMIEYHIFDIQSEGTYKNRLTYLNELIPKNHQYLKVVPTVQATTDQIANHLDSAVSAGFEGIMVKDPNGRYEHNTRSTSTQKLKPSFCESFKVVDIVTSEQGREKGRAIAVCITDQGKPFRCRLAYDNYMAEWIYKNRHKYAKSYAIVDFKGYTSDGYPRESRCRQLVQGTLPKKKGRK